MLSRRLFVKQHGFTIIELLISIVIIGILATIGTLNYGYYQKSLTVSQVKSDLNGVNTAMENARTFKDAYPTYVADLAANQTFTPSPTVTLSGGSYDGGKTYCVDAVSSRDPSVKYYIDSNNGLQGAQIGSCAFAHPVPTNLLATKATNTLLNISWDAVPGATNYTLQRDTAATFTSGSLTVVSQAGTTTPSTVVQGVNYYYRVNATLPDMTSGWSDMISANTNINPPTVPTVLVALSAGNAQGAINVPASCGGSGSVQYAFRSRTNDGTWGSYSTWSATTSASQPAIQGVKFGYQAQARCYVDVTLFGSSSTGLEATYVHPITTVPATPAVGASVPNWATTTYTWGATSCAAGSTARYQYYFSTSYGYNSGWVAIAGTSINLTTSSSGYTYTLQVQAQCYSSYSTGPWSASGSASYYRPYSVTVLVVAGGGAGGAGDSYGNGGGGGAGGYVYSGYTVSPGGWWTTVGGGGGNGGSANAGGNGGNSGFGSLVAIGGGGGGGGTNTINGRTGGSGGGGSGSASNGRPGSEGTAGQGNKGGGSSTAAARGAGGGGGASGVGDCGSCHTGSVAGNGGSGVTFSISGSNVCYAGGGGGGIGSGSEGSATCGGGNAHQTQGGNTATANTGGGGGGGKGSGGGGGSGIVIIRYNPATMNADGGSKYANGSDYVHVFTGSGTFTVY